jgi:hypothetical protein
MNAGQYAANGVRMSFACRGKAASPELTSDTNVERGFSSLCSTLQFWSDGFLRAPASVWNSRKRPIFHKATKYFGG